MLAAVIADYRKQVLIAITALKAECILRGTE